MVEFVSYDQALEISRREVVVFAEVFAAPGSLCSLEVHVEAPHKGRLREIERDDTGPVTKEEVPAIVARIADRHQAKFAAIFEARATWPPAPK